MDYSEIREEVCKDCRYGRGCRVNNCSLYEESAIDYNRKKCKYKSKQEASTKD